MLLEVGAGGEVFVANGALEGLLSRVYSLMSDQIGDLNSAFKLSVKFLIFSLHHTKSDVTQI